MADKTQFRTIESDREELDAKIRRHRLKIVKIMLLVAGIILLAAAGVFMFLRLRTYQSYTVSKSVVREDSASTHFLPYGSGFIRYSNDGAIYTDAMGEMFWSQAYEMQEPIVEQGGDYVAFADQGGTTVYILNESGLQGVVETPMAIEKISVAGQGTIAVLMEKDGANHIRLYDKNGKNLASGALHVENSGYPMDIALCEDGKKLAVSMLDVTEGQISAVLYFYNFGSVGQNEIDNLVGTYSYEGLIIPQIEFVTNDRLLAFGDSRILFFEGSQRPEQEQEIEFSGQARSVFFNESYVGIITNNDEKADETRHMEVYDSGGKRILRKNFSMDYESVEFLQNGEICIRSGTELLLYNTYGVKKFAYTFDTAFYGVLSGHGQTEYIFILEGRTDRVRLK